MRVTIRVLHSRAFICFCGQTLCQKDTAISMRWYDCVGCPLVAAANMRRGGSVSAATVAISSIVAITAEQRRTNILHSSQYKKNQFPYQWIVPKSLANRQYGLALKSRPAAFAAAAAATQAGNKSVEDAEVEWTSDKLVMAQAASNSQPTKSDGAVAKPRLPIDTAAKVELRGDYLTEAGRGEEALHYFGVAMSIYELHYPANHNHLAKLRVKLARAFRMSNRNQSAIANANAALDILDNVHRPEVEHICEALMELGMAHRAAGDEEKASIAFEDAVEVLALFHDIGASHRGLRGLTQATRRFYENVVSKLRYFSPFEYDRVFSIVDTCLTEAERCHQQRNDKAGVIRVLEVRKALLDKKFFNMRDYMGKIRVMRGHNYRKSYSIAARPSADEILGFSPSIHQVYFDYSRLDTAPLGKEHLVQLGANAKYLDDGDPTRFYVSAAKSKEASVTAARDFVQQQWDSAAINAPRPSA